jgi:nucleotide-binding universal stress UspA family protein
MTMTILVASDFSDTAARALQEALHLARATGARLEIAHIHVVRTVPIPPTLDLVTLRPTPEEVARAEESLAQQTKLAKDAGVECSSYSSFGVPADELARRATEIGARYLVVGRHGHRAITEVLIGSVALRTIRLAACPVLVVPASDHTA